jgi:hypothetical protein
MRDEEKRRDPVRRGRDSATKNWASGTRHEAVLSR